MPLCEVRLWNRLRRSALGYRFRRQHPIGPYIADFACVGLRLIVEVDGDSHYASEAAAAYDRDRSRFLEENRFRVLRVTNAEVSRDISAVCEAIIGACGDAALAHRTDSGGTTRRIR